MSAFRILAGTKHVASFKAGAVLAINNMDVNGADASFQSLGKALKMESVRPHGANNRRMSTPGDPVWDAMKTFCKALFDDNGCTSVVQIPMWPDPDNSLSSQTPMVAANIAAGFRSPSSVATAIVAWLTDSRGDLGLRKVEIGNECAVEATTTGGVVAASPPGYYSYTQSSALWAPFGTDPAQSPSQAAHNWGVVHHRAYVQAIQNAVQAAGKSPLEYYGLAIANLQEANGAIDQAVRFGWQSDAPGSWPYGASDTNLPWFQTISAHPYAQISGHAGDFQASINSILYTPSTSAKTTVLAGLQALRFRMDAKYGAGNGKKIAVTENALLDNQALARGDWLGCLADCLCAAVVADYAPSLQLDSWHYHSFDNQLLSDNVTSVSGVLAGTAASSPPYKPTLRYYAWKDICFPFMREKTVLNVVEDVAPGLTPASSVNNAIKRHVVQARLKSNNHFLVMLCDAVYNASASTEPLSLTLPGTPTGPITGVKLANTSAYLPGAAIPAITPFTPSSAVFTLGAGGAPTLGPGEIILLDIPMAAGGGGGTSNPRIHTVTDDFTGTNGSAPNPAIWTVEVDA